MSKDIQYAKDINKSKDKEQSYTDSYTEEEIQKALDLIKSPDLIQKHFDFFNTRYLGRESELLLLKLATVSRKFSKGLSVIVTGSASVGKSELIKTVLDSVCPDDVESFTRISKQYLMYKDRNLNHKILTIFEMQGAYDTAHILRTALSEGELSLGTVDKSKNSGLTPMESRIETKGLVFFSTSTSGKIDWELDTRILKIELSHDEELARQVLKHKANPQQSEGRDNRIFQLADYLIKPHDVVIPYWNILSDLFPTDQERHIRDFDKVLTLIKSSALLHQYHREKDENEAIIASRKDYEIVYNLRHQISESILPLQPHLMKFLQTASNLNKSGTLPTRKMLCNQLNKTDRTIRNYIDRTKDYIICSNGYGINQKIEVIEIPNMINPLPSPTELFSIDKDDFQISNKTQAIGNKRDNQETLRFPVLIPFPEIGNKKKVGKDIDFQKVSNDFRNLYELEKWKVNSDRPNYHSESCECRLCIPLDTDNLDFDIGGYK